MPNWREPRTPEWVLKNFGLFLALVLLLPILLGGGFPLGARPANAPAKPLSEEAIQKKVDVLTKVLKYGTSLERKAALAEIEKLPEENQKGFHSMILEFTKKEREPTMRLAFFRVIGSLKIAEAQEELYKALEEGNEDSARSAIAALRKVNSAGSWEKVLERLRKEDLTKNSNLTISLIEALSEMDGGEGSAGFLESKLKEKFNSPEIRAQIALFFGKKKISNAEITLQQIAFNDSETLTLRMYSINSLGKIQSQTSVPKLRELIEAIRKEGAGGDSRKNQMLKIYSLGALVELGDENVFDEIVEFTRDDDSLVRLRSIHFLAETRKPEAKEILEYKSVRDPSPRVQRAAKDALKKWDESPTGGPPPNTTDEPTNSTTSPNAQDEASPDRKGIEGQEKRP